MQETVEERVGHLTVPLMTAREDIVVKAILSPQCGVHSLQLGHGLPCYFSGENRVVNASLDQQWDAGR